MEAEIFAPAENIWNKTPPPRGIIAKGRKEDLSCLQKPGQGSHTSFIHKFKMDNCLHLFKQS